MIMSFPRTPALLIKLLAFGCFIASAVAIPSGFSYEKKMTQKGLTPIQLMWIDNDRALLLDRKGTIYIAKPNEIGFPKEVYTTVRLCASLLTSLSPLFPFTLTSAARSNEHTKDATPEPQPSLPFRMTHRLTLL
jgi:hypothetical protein